MENVSMQEQTNEVALIINNSIPILQKAPDVLKQNESLKEKALNVGKSILQAHSDSGLSAELDQRAMKFLANVEAARTKMKDDRSGITQIMDELKKMYTTAEAELDPKKDGTIPFQIQSIRNNYAKKVAQEAEAKRKQEELIANKKKEAIDIRSQIQIALNNIFNDSLLSNKQRLLAKFNEIKFEEFAVKSINLKNYNPDYLRTNLDSFYAKPITKYITHEEVGQILSEVVEASYPAFKDKYVSEMLALKQELVDKLPSKQAELEEQKRLADEAEKARVQAELEERERQEAIARANEEERIRLEAEAEEKRKADAIKQAELAKEQERLEQEKRKREQEENDRIAQEAEKAKLEAQQQEEMKAQGDQTMVMFEKEAALAETTEAPEARQGYEINVLHPVGYTQIFALWFEKVGKDLPVDKLGNTKLDQMKAWAEKEAHKSGTKIDSKFLKYEETYKAVNRKAK